MAGPAVEKTARERVLAPVDRALSSFLRYDVRREEAFKWVYFTRQALFFILFCVVSISALSALFSIRQADRLLRDSLRAEAQAIAGAAARAAFVPLALQDPEALEQLVDSYRDVDHLASVRVLDSQERPLHEMSRPGSDRDEPLRVTAPVVALDERPGAGRRPLGWVEVSMRTDWIRSRGRAVALANLVIAGTLSMLVLAVGTVLLRRLVERMRELVGEARLVAEVKRVNAELETFSYSVAHDLRAPLRAVDGFSQALAERSGAALDEEGRDYLRRVRAASRRMSQLIDDLLNLSRVTRGDLKVRPIDMSAMAREIAAQLTRSKPERPVDWVVADGVIARGDPNLVRAALENLLGNSWKYTERHPRARIEFGTVWKDGERAYYVKDDGAGFDMAFASKLFKPFSRLHLASEFEGTGIGLATVQRIVERHGGRVWGEGAPEAGATFYFTLGS